MLFDIKKDICIEKETLAFWKELDFGGPETFSLLLFLESSRVLGEPKLIYLEVVSISAQKLHMAQFKIGRVITTLLHSAVTRPGSE